MKMPSPADIRAARRAFGLTQSQAGALCGVTDRAWRYWERGEREMPKGMWELFNIKTKVEKMRSVTIKTLCDNDASSTIAPDNSPLGNFRDASLQVRKINNVPSHITNAEVLKAWRETSDITWLGGRDPRLEFDFAEIGGGKIIKR